MARKEIINRLSHVANLAKKDGITPEEYVRRKLREALYSRNPFINPDSKFVVLGIDGFDRSMLPVGSFKTKDEAFKRLRQEEAAEHFYSDGEEISTTFYVFTMEGVHVPLAER